jgi:hypothetical protein
MKPLYTALAGLLLATGTASFAQAPASPNPLIDYAGFADLVRELGPVREAHRLPWSQFEAAMSRDGAILLDTRSAADFARGHIDGAINLPFSEFTDARLAATLGEDRQRPILIYCNNNFSDNVAPVMTKRAPLALNIPTFVNLHGYGYSNVWELADVMSISDPRLRWISGS